MLAHAPSLLTEGRDGGKRNVTKGAIVGAGSVRKFSAVRWGVAGRIVWAWILTVPCAAAISAASYLLGT